MYILVLGNPIEGFKFEGLFTSTQDAIAYGEKHHGATEWWTAYLTLNKEYEEHMVGAEPTNIAQFPQNLECSCGHIWDLHRQNVHGVYVCNQCNCRGMQPPFEIPKSEANDF